jgi:ABC-type lipoprotein release transport system permease subunit
MRARRFILRNLTHFWRTNLAVVLGAATTVAVLAGALLVGDSVRASLRELALMRLGRATHAVTSEYFFREGLAEALTRGGHVDAAPLVVLEGLVTHEKSGRRGARVHVYGVDARFWKFHGRANAAPERREALLSPALAAELGAAAGDSILVRVPKPSAVPVDSLHGRKEDMGRTMRLTLRGALPAPELGEFSLRPQQGEVRAVFVPLARLQQDLDQPGRVNAVLLAEKAPDASAPLDVFGVLQQVFALEDLGLKLRLLGGQKAIALESEHILIEDAVAETARGVAKERGLASAGFFTYLANAIRAGDREIPYSLVTAVEESSPLVRDAGRNHPELPPIFLNEWALRDLDARPGQTVRLEFYAWQPSGVLTQSHRDFELRGAVPLASVSADRALSPAFPGIADSPSLSDWDPPFPVDLRRIRPRDEDYWDRYRTTPKAFLHLKDGQHLWASRFGRVTSLRFSAPPGQPLPKLEELAAALRAALEPAQAGFTVHAVRQEGTAASRGAVNFSEYFVYFSFFLVVSATLLTGLFFKLGVEQRLREIGLLRAVGFPPQRIRRIFLGEGAVLAALGSALGAAGAVGFAAGMMYGLRTWWVGAVGTTLLRLHVEPLSLAEGAVGGIAAALIAVGWALRGLAPASPRNLMAGVAEPETGQPRARRLAAWAMGFAAAGAALLGAALLGSIGQAAGFFGSGAALLLALVFFQWDWLHVAARGGAHATGGFGHFGLRNAAWRPGRSLLCIGLIAAATFILVAVESFRRSPDAHAAGVNTGTGGFALLADAQLPIAHDLNLRANLETLGLGDAQGAALAGAKFFSFRQRPGDDASCLNLYQPKNPQVLGVPADLLRSGRFAFQSSVASTPEPRANPWLLLEADAQGGAIPAAGDANSLAYVLHRKVGDEFTLPNSLDPATGQPVRLRIVAALADSIFQSGLLISEKNFLRVFPAEPGFRFFLIETPEAKAPAVAAALEAGLRDFGFDAQPAGERLAVFHRVESTYISTFQALGGLGLLLGTVGLAAVLLRNVLERRREIALLRAVGYRAADVNRMVLAENALLLVCGLVTGVVPAVIAIAPALAARGGPAGSGSVVVLLLAVLGTGLAASLAAVVAVKRAPLLAALRSE